MSYRALIALVLASTARVIVQGETYNLKPARLVSIMSNGKVTGSKASTYYIGRVGASGGNRLARTLVYFDTSKIPKDAEVTSAHLHTRTVKSQSQKMAVYEVTKSWTASSDNTCGSPLGCPPKAGDATWTKRSPSATWLAEGGDYTGSALHLSASAGDSFPDRAETSELLKDSVAGWVASPSSNLGWILLGNEGMGTNSAKESVPDLRLVVETKPTGGQVEVAATITPATGKLEFNMAELKIKQGDSVNFQTTAAHNVVQATGAGSCKALAGGFSVDFSSEKVIKFEKEEEVYVFCNPHCASGMRMKIIVGSPSQTCTNNLYLLEGTGCVVSCPGSLIPWGLKANGRVCRAPFTCRLSEGCACEAPGGCAVCEVTPQGSTCTTCKDTRFPVEGKCPKEAFCKGGKLVGNPDKLACSCNTDQFENPRCRQCKLVGGTAAPLATCQKCKDSKYLHAGPTGFCGEAAACSLPAVPTGVNAIGRICTAPFTCRKGRATDGDRPGSKCSCTEKRNCHTCAWAENGDACTICLSKFYATPLGICAENCLQVSGFPQQITHGGATGSGRACEAPFTCAGDVHSVTQGKCRCKDKKKCKSCEYRAGNEQSESFCTSCKGKFVPNAAGVCVQP